MARQVKIEILGDARGLRRAFSEADRASTGFAKGIAKAGLFAATGLAGLVAGVGVAAGKSIQAAQESNKISKQTAAVIKSTGGAAKVTAKQISDLATAISMKTGIDDEAVQASENMLLTFTNIKNAAGKNNDIFTQATKITQDMAVALGQDGTQSAMQLGKALQDPVKGVTALRRVGVAFTADQQKQIKTLVDSGHTMEAQKLILRELGKEFGGSAAAAATPLDKLKVIVGNVSEAVGNLLLPIVNKAANWLGARLPGAVSLLQTGLHALGQAFKGEGVTSTGFVGVMERIGVALSVVIPAVQRFASEQLPRLQHAAQLAGQFITGVLIPALMAIFGWINDHKTLVQSLAVGILAIVGAIKVWAAVTKTMAVVQGILNVVLTANPIGLIIVAIAGLAAGLIYAYKHSETFRKIVDGSFQAIKGVVGTVVNFIIGLFRAWFNTSTTVVEGILHMFGKLPGPLGAPFRKAEEAVRNAKKTVNTELDKIQNRVNRLTGKDIPVTASLKLNFSPTYTQKDWVADRARAGRMAGGGMLRGPGTGTSDSIPLWGSKGEFMVNAASTSKWLPMLKFINADRKATGGPVGQIGTQTGAVNKIEARGTGSRFRAGLAAFVKAFGGGDIKAFLRAADALPYIWGGVGPGGYDCSGLTGEVFARMTHRPSYRRYFTTASNFGALGFKPGPGGRYTIGVNAAGGHMAGRYGGLAFEAANTRAGIRIGSAARSVSTFPQQYHMAKGGLVEWLANRPGVVIGGDPAMLRLERFDRGGMLQPGMSLAYNGTGRAEPVGIDYNALAEAIVRALRRNPPTVAVTDIHQGLLNQKRSRGGVALGLS